MYTDIVIPNENEEEFIEIASKLGYLGICFVYPEKDFKPKNIITKKIDVFFGVLCEQGDVKRARKKSDFVLVENPEDARLCVEREAPDVIFNFENQSRKDFIHQRNSGMDHIIARFMEKKGIFSGFSLLSIFEQKEKDVFMGRVMQNIFLLEKYNTGFLVASFAKEPYAMKNPEDIASLFSTLGMNKKKAKASMEKIPLIFERNEKIKKGLLGEGIELLHD